MRRDASIYLLDIRSAIAKIRTYTSGMDRAAFLADPKTVDAVLHNLEIVGEAAKRVPPRLRQLAPDIEWRKISGMRDLLAHVYFQVDLEIVWDVVAEKLGPLDRALERVIAQNPLFDD
jgi:uncharacterized protein with HEPN domain